MKMENPNVRRAWREKVGLCFIAFVLCTALAYLTFAFQNTTCVPDKIHYRFGETRDTGQVLIHGKIYNMKPVLASHQSSQFFAPNAAGETTFPYVQYAKPGIDISPYFPLKLTDSCAKYQDPSTAECSDPINFPGIKYCHNAVSSQQTVNQNLLGPIYYTYKDVQNNPDLVIYNNKILNIKLIRSGMSFYSPDVQNTLINHSSKDVTRTFQTILNGKEAGDCAVAQFTVGHLDGDSAGCFIAYVVLYVSLIIICSLIIAKFLFAVYFSWAISSELGALEKNRAITQATRRRDIKSKHFAFSMGDLEGTTVYPAYLRDIDIEQPSETTMEKMKSKSKYAPEIYTMYYKNKSNYFRMLVTCYSENENEIRNTFESLALTDYSEDYKVLFVVADGMVKGQGNSITTPEIVLNLLQLDENWPEPMPMAYVAVANGPKQLNYAKVYVAWYEFKGRSVPTIVVVKTGNPDEQTAAKPGNRGKRDSQIMLMKFLEHITFNSNLCPFEYDLFQKLHFLMGVTPDHFEIVLMVDADTKVAPDSLARMVACMGRDPLIMGLCGETRIGNKSQSYVYYELNI